MRARVPGSSANLGPGFDALALAIDRHITVEVNPAPKFHCESAGEGTDFACDESHPAAELAIQLLGHDKFHITVESELPVARGLGSSAAVSAAVAGACGAPDPFRIAAEFDGHAENAAASVFGGLVSAAMLPQGPVVRRLPLDSALAVVAIVPEATLSTEKAREALPKELPYKDAMFNLGRMGLLIAGLADIASLTPACTEDRLHQSYRSALFPDSDRYLILLTESGALASCWSGAGTTIIGFCHRDQAKSIADTVEAKLDKEGASAHVLTLAPDVAGLTIKS